jgi:hypothetical protein
MKNILDGRKDGQTDRGKTVYPPPPSGSGGIINVLWLLWLSSETHSLTQNLLIGEIIDEIMKWTL